MRARLSAVALAVALTGVAAPSPASAETAAAAPAARAAGTCVAPQAPFTPTKVKIPAIGRSVGVVRVRRTATGAVGTPPVSKRGKWQMGLDRQVRPGAGQGSVIMAAHTWPDGSALGNALRRSLRTGDRVVLTRGKGAKRACYEVTKRKAYRAAKVPRSKAFRWWGPEQLVIVVCSGKRLGPGKWTHRTIWYATPVAD